MSWIAFSFLEEIRHDLKHSKDSNEQVEHRTEMVKEYDIYLGEYQKTYHATLGQALRYVQERHQELFLEWVYHYALSGTPVEELHALLAA
jgi:hypothetical protein